MKLPNGDDVMWGVVDYAVSGAPLHVMLKDIDYWRASACKGRPSNGQVASGDINFKNVNQCIACLRWLAENA